MYEERRKGTNPDGEDNDESRSPTDGEEVEVGVEELVEMARAKATLEEERTYAYFESRKRE